MRRSITVALDEAALRALARLEATGSTRSEAIGAALLAAVSRLEDQQTLAAEVAALEADPHDQREMLAVAGLMAGLRPAG